MRSFTLRREERLRGQVAVSKLFADHRVVVRFPFRIHYVQSQGPESFRVLFVVSSRKYRKAPMRTPSIHSALIYTGPPEVSYNELLPSFRQLLTKLREHVEKPAD